MGEKAVTQNSTENPVEHSLTGITSCESVFEPSSFRTSLRELLGLPKRGQATESGSYRTDLKTSSLKPGGKRNPKVKLQTETRNEVTPMFALRTRSIA